MKIRLLHLITSALIFGSIFFVGSVYSADTSNEEITITNQISLDMPAKMADGHNQARRIFIDEHLVDIPLNWSWNYLPKKPTDALVNWLFYGSLGEEAEQFMIGVQFEGKTPMLYSGLRSRISGLKIFNSKKIKIFFVGSDQKIQTSYGPLNIAYFGYKHQGITKACIGYLSTPSTIKLLGFYCPKTDVTLSSKKLVCLVDSLKIYDDAYWREPQESKQDRTSCPVNEAAEKKT